MIDSNPGINITSVSPETTRAELSNHFRALYPLALAKYTLRREMKATITVSGYPGQYTLTPSSITYYNLKKRYTGACNTATIVFRQEMLPIESKQGNNSIEVLWTPSSNAGIVGYRVYKRTSTSDYNLVNSFYTTGLSYTDTDIQNSVAYYYRVAAVDQSGNEIDVSPETAEMLLNTKIRTYGAPVGQSIAIGDIDGNGIPDLVVGNPYSGNKGISREG